MKFNEKFSIVSLRGKLYNKYSSKDGNHEYLAWAMRMLIEYILDILTTFNPSNGNVIRILIDRLLKKLSSRNMECTVQWFASCENLVTDIILRIQDNYRLTNYEN